MKSWQVVLAYYYGDAYSSSQLVFACREQLRGWVKQLKVQAVWVLGGTLRMENP